MATSNPTHKQTKKGKQKGERRRLRKRGRIKRQGWSGGEENERQMANNVNAREMSLWLVLGMSWLEWRPPRQLWQKSFLLRLELALVFLEEERVMQQSSVSISLSFWEPRYQSSRRLLKSPTHLHKQTKNLATNAIKGLSIPSRPLAKVRSDKDNKINIFGIFVV